MRESKIGTLNNLGLLKLHLHESTALAREEVLLFCKKLKFYFEMLIKVQENKL